MPNDRYQLVLHHPTNGPGCLTVDGGGTYTETLLAGALCEPGRPDQEFTFEHVTSPAEGYRLRSVAGAKWCVGVYLQSTEPGSSSSSIRATTARTRSFC